MSREFVPRGGWPSARAHWHVQTRLDPATVTAQVHAIFLPPKRVGLIGAWQQMGSPKWQPTTVLSDQGNPIAAMQCVSGHQLLRDTVIATHVVEVPEGAWLTMRLMAAPASAGLLGIPADALLLARGLLRDVCRRIAAIDPALTVREGSA